MEKLDRAFAVLLVVIAFVVGFVIGVQTAVKVEREAAIKGGVGYWEQIDCGEDTRFVYGLKTPCENSQEFDSGASEGKDD